MYEKTITRVYGKGYITLFNTGYNFYKGKLETVVEIIICWSKKGYNTQSIMNKFDLSYEQFMGIKKYFKLRKNCRMPEELLQEVSNWYGEDYLDEFISSTTDNYVDSLLSNKFENEMTRKENKKIEDIKRWYFGTQKTVDIFENAVNKITGIKKSGFKVFKKVNNNGHLVVFISDIHLGMRGHNGIKERLKYIADFLRKAEEKNIEIFMLGDLVETLVEEGMHTNQVGKMDIPDVIELAKEAIQIMIDFNVHILENGKKVTFHAISGNHDRGIQEHRLFYRNVTGLLLHSSIGNRLNSFKGMSYKYYEDVRNVVETGGFNIIFCHGDDGNLKKSYDQVMRFHGNHKLFNVWAHGHLHYAYYNDRGTNMIDIGVGPLAGKSDYAENLLLSGNNSFTTLKMNEFGLPEVAIKQIK